MRLISICNHKGGCGKSATATNLAACLAMKGKHVLLIDLDPQCTATDALGLDVDKLGRQMYDVMVKEANLKDIVRSTEVSGLDIAPCNMDLKVAEKQIEGQEGNEYILKVQMASLDGFDFVIMDTPPNIGPLTLNSMAVATELIIPIQCEYCSLRGMSQLMNVADMAEEALGNQPKRRILLTMYTRTNIGNQVVEAVRSHYGEKAYRSVIPRNIKVAEGPAQGKPVVVYAPDSTGSVAYQALAVEVLKDE
ncbi:MAG: ParA family protein [Methanotrichaceae archaeon]